MEENPTPKEIQDQLTRSNKKPKTKITHEIFGEDVIPDNNLGMEIDQQQGKDVPILPRDFLPSHQTQNPQNQAKKRISFRDFMLSQQNQNAILEFVEGDSDDDVSDDDEPPEDIEDTEKCAVILLSKEEKKRMRKPWKNTLIIKMFNGRLGYMGLMKRLQRIWQLKGSFSLTDIGCKFFIARFTNYAYYNFVLIQGPC